MMASSPMFQALSFKGAIHMGNRFGYSTSASQHPQSSVYAEDRSALIQDDQVKKVLRNTYALLAMTLLFSAAIATAAVSFQWKAPGLILTLVGFFGLLFGGLLNVYKLQKSYNHGKLDSNKEFKLKQGIVKNFLDSRPLSPTSFLNAPGVALLNEVKTSLPEYQKISDKEINQNPA